MASVVATELASQGQMAEEDLQLAREASAFYLKLSEALRPHGYFYPDNPASYPCSLVGGRIGTSGWSLIGARYGLMR